MMLTDARLGAEPFSSLTENVHAIELASEMECLTEYIDIDLAHVVVLYDCGALGNDTAANLLRALLALTDSDSRIQVDPQLGSVLLQVEEYLYQTCGSDGGMLQLARSRIDQNAEALRLISRRHVLAVLEDVLTLAGAELEAATRFDAVIVPGYTHLQHSQPTTLGHYLNSQYWGCSRAIERMSECLARIDQLSLGGVALSGTDWPIDRTLTSVLLGHPRLVENARDSGVFALDIGAEVAMSMAMALSGLARMAGDLYFWSSSEIEFVRLHPGLCGTSSMMPQKRNPYALERVRALAGEAIGWPSTQLGVLKTATSTDCDLVFTRNRVPEMCESTGGAARLLTDVVATLEVDQSRLLRSAQSRWSCASALADELVRTGHFSFRSAHDVVGRMVRIDTEEASSASDARQPSGDLVSLFRSALVESGHDDSAVDAGIGTMIGAERFVETRSSAGGCSSSERDRLAQLAHADFAGHRTNVADIRRRIDNARSGLIQRAREIASV